MTPATLALCFTMAVIAEIGIRLWLSARQVRAVRAHRDVVPELLRDRITLVNQQRSADYTVARVQLSRWATLYEGAIKLSLTVGGGIGLINDACAHSNIDEPWRGLMVIGSTFLLLQLAGVPFALLRIFKIEAHFGFNRVSPLMFATDCLKGFVLSLLLGFPVVLCALLLMQRGGSGWWLWAWCASLAWTIALAWVAPRYIAPLFNRFTPLEDAAVRSRMESLLTRCGFAAGGIYVMDGSRRSAHANAYFTGIGRSKRIVFIDTLLERISAAEIEAVMAHELGHFRFHHVTQRLMVSSALSLIGLAALAWAVQQPWVYGAFRIEDMSAESALLLFAMAAPVVMFFARPLVSWFYRRQERQADDFAVQHADPKILSEALIKLFRDNASTLTPDALHSAFFDSHPPALERIKRLQL